jgi:hypothetical protein
MKTRRRAFITLLGGAAAWPLAAQAQQGDRVRRIGVLLGAAEGDGQAESGFAAFKKALAELGWIEGRNLRIEIRFGAADVDSMQAFAKELVGLKPDLILSQTTPVTAALQHETPGGGEENVNSVDDPRAQAPAGPRTRVSSVLLCNRPGRGAEARPRNPDGALPNLWRAALDSHAPAQARRRFRCRLLQLQKRLFRTADRDQRFTSCRQTAPPQA